MQTKCSKHLWVATDSRAFAVHYTIQLLTFLSLTILILISNIEWCLQSIVRPDVCLAKAFVVKTTCDHVAAAFTVHCEAWRVSGQGIRREDDLWPRGSRVSVVVPGDEFHQKLSTALAQDTKYETSQKSAHQQDTSYYFFNHYRNCWQFNELCDHIRISNTRLICIWNKMYRL